MKTLWGKLKFHKGEKTGESDSFSIKHVEKKGTPYHSLKERGELDANLKAFLCRKTID